MGELAALGLGIDHPSSYMGCSAHGHSSPWHHLVTHILTTRHWGPAQALFLPSCHPTTGEKMSMARGHMGSRLLLEEPFLLSSKWASFQAQITRLPALTTADIRGQSWFLAPPDWKQGEKSLFPHHQLKHLPLHSPCGTRVMSWELAPRKFCTVHLRSRGSSTLCSCRVLFTRYTCSSAWYVALVCRPISADSFPSSRVGCPLVLHLARGG